MTNNLECYQSTDLLSSSRLPPVPEEPTISSEDTLYRSGMSVDTYNPQNYIADSQNSTTVTMPTSQMTIHGICANLIFLKVAFKPRKHNLALFSGTSNNTQIMSMPDQNKNAEQLRMYDNGRLFNSNEIPNNMLASQDMMSSFTQSAYEQSTEQLQAGVYAGKAPRVQYVNTQNKIITQPEVCYPKYNTRTYHTYDPRIPLL